jgi:hypothetical protein
LRRRCYVTPRAYLDFLALYASIARRQGAELQAKRGRLLDGIARLQACARGRGRGFRPCAQEWRDVPRPPARTPRRAPWACRLAAPAEDQALP